MRLVKSVFPGVVLLLLGLSVGGAAPLPLPCPNYQSPRNVNPNAKPWPYNGRSDRSIVVSISPSQDQLQYRPRETAAEETLYRCGQHYHVPVEDVQGCTGEAEVITPPVSPPGKEPAPGQWIEVHTAYSSNRPPSDCADPESLDCCTGKTVLVLGFSAKVAEKGDNLPILTPESKRLAEWSGSSTGLKYPKESPTDCKGPAVWSYRLGCTFKVNQTQLAQRLKGGPQAARPLQGADRVSHDLYLVKPRKTPKKE